MTLPDATRDDWDQHWGLYASSAEDNPAQRYRRRLAFRALASASTPERIVDVGSGQGDLLVALASAFPTAELVGIELSAAGVEQGRRKVPRASFVQQDLLHDRSVDAPFERWATHAVCSEVLEHVEEPVRLLRNASRYFAPGCRVVVTVPGGPMSAFDEHIGHRRHYTKTTLIELLRTAGLDVVSVSAAGFPVFNLYKLLIVARGQRLVDDVRGDAGGATAHVARAAMTLFRPLFRLARNDSRWGWQIVAIATVPGAVR
jgi:SAM-dependent methyltransferase